MRIILLSFLLATAPACATAAPAFAPQLGALDVQAGHWIYHGQTVATPKHKAITFTWDEHCSWSADKLFLMCSFDNDWGGNKAQSLVVDTWNDHDKTYWHYEMFAVGGSGAKPFISKMTINGNTWTEYGEDDDNGKKSFDRIVYRYTSPTRVAVNFEISTDGKHWTAFAQAEGKKSS